MAALAVYLGSAVTQRRRRAYTPATRWRDISILFTTASLALYVWGCLHIFFLYGTEGGEDCFTLSDLENGVKLNEAAGDFIPLRLICHMSDGRSHSIVIPDYINPSIAALLLIAVAAGIASVVLHRKQCNSLSQRKERPS
ncbi:hypothetical protein OG735_22650 [Streptomyces sp. NBC_01210]|uniref:hypothetical protein n=1 Tax=Streptomyces sp. NBC_01210 TaxID=2903774 RepID=UPI002E0D7693|nr:hypothetical protein OG735_22650 [Streptomyces sp. NBC_01210]